MSWDTFIYYFSFLYPTVLLMGIFCAFDVVMKGRSSQGIIAWSLCLIIFPFITVPFYLVFGGRKYHGYVKARRKDESKLKDTGNLLLNKLSNHITSGEEAWKKALENIAKLPVTSGNKVELLINGEAKFEALISALNEAQEYILFQYYMIRDDKTGREIKDLLIKKASEGVRVYFLYDAIGSYELSSKFLKQLSAAGVHVTQFGNYRFVKNKFQLNFRNHRKIVVIDGQTAFCGGLNVGDEYKGLDPDLSPWRDTHLKITGPGALCVQLVFLEDWYSMVNSEPEKLSWDTNAAGNSEVLVLPTGPADELESCTLAFITACNSAKKTLWMTSPYFVPSKEVLSALEAAVQRGVDVRVIVPNKADNLIVQMSSQCFIDTASNHGVKFYRYKEGFLHEKVILVDEQIAVVGTVNLDNRSFSLNFELMVYLFDKETVSAVASMLKEDFANSEAIPVDEFSQRSFWYRLVAKIYSLGAPLQ